VAVHHAAAGERHQRNFLLFARLKADGRAGGNIQTHAVSGARSKSSAEFTSKK
jgi:hypothetical protein